MPLHAACCLCRGNPDARWSAMPGRCSPLLHAVPIHPPPWTQDMEPREIGSVLRHPTAGAQIAGCVAAFPYLQARLAGWEGRRACRAAGQGQGQAELPAAVLPAVRCTLEAAAQVRSVSFLPPHSCAPQLEAHLHPITRTVLRIQLTINPAFNWKDGWVPPPACRLRACATWRCQPQNCELLATCACGWLHARAQLPRPLGPACACTRSCCDLVFQSRCHRPRSPSPRSVHGNALKWLVWVEDSANEHIYHSGSWKCPCLSTFLLRSFSHVGSWASAAGRSCFTDHLPTN